MKRPSHSPGPIAIRVGIAPYMQMNSSCLSLYYTNGDRTCEPGMELELLSVVADIINATLKIVTTSNNFGCGALAENGTWTGLLGMLERDEIDVTGNLCTIVGDRIGIESFEPSWPVLQHRQGFLIRKPSAEYQFNVFAPFTLPIWLTLITLAVVVWTLTCVAARLNDSIRQNFWFIFDMLFFNYFPKSGSWCKNRNFPEPKLLWITWIASLALTCTIYAAYITVVVLNPVVKDRPFANQIELADALLRGEYRLLDYHRSRPSLPRCYSDSVCEKFQAAVDRHSYVRAVSDSYDGQNDPFLDQLLDRGSGKLVVVNSFYWLQLYADSFGGRRSDLWLIRDDLAGQQWYSYFRRRNTTFANAFDSALIKMDTFKENLPQLYVGMARYVHQGTYFRGEFPEIFHVDMEEFTGPMKFYLIGAALAIVIFCAEKGWNVVYHRYTAAL